MTTLLVETSGPFTRLSRNEDKLRAAVLFPINAIPPGAVRKHYCRLTLFPLKKGAFVPQFPPSPRAINSVEGGREGGNYVPMQELKLKSSIKRRVAAPTGPQVGTTRRDISHH